MGEREDMGASYGPGSRPADQAPTGLGATRFDPSRGVGYYLLALVVFFGGLALTGLAFQVLTEGNLPPAIGFPVVTGMGTLGLMAAIGSLGAIIDPRDSDTDPKGGDGTAPFIGSAGLKGIAQPTSSDTPNAK